MANTIKLTWGRVDGAVSYNIYHSVRPKLSVAHTPLLINTIELVYEHVGLVPLSAHYYIIAAVGPNGEIGTPSNEVFSIVTNIAVLISLSVIIDQNNFNESLLNSLMIDPASTVFDGTNLWICDSGAYGGDTTPTPKMIRIINPSNPYDAVTTIDLTSYGFDVVRKLQLSSDGTKVFANCLALSSTGFGRCLVIDIATKTVVGNAKTTNGLVGADNFTSAGARDACDDGAGNLWVTNSNSSLGNIIEKFSIASLLSNGTADTASILTVSTPDHAEEICFGAGYLWTGSANFIPKKLTRIDPTSGAVSTYTSPDSNAIWGPVFAFGKLWAGGGNGHVLRFDPAQFGTGGFRTHVLNIGGANMRTAFAVEGSYLWAGTNNSPAVVAKINPTDMSFTTPLTISGTDGFTGMASVGNNYIWATRRFGPTPDVVRIHTSSGSESYTPFIIGNYILETGFTQKLIAIGKFSDLSTQDISNSVAWSSTNNSIATVNSSGLVTPAGASGTVQIHAISGIFNSLSTISTKSIISIKITVASQTLSAIQFLLTATYDDLTTSDATNKVTWISYTTSVGTINSAGLFTILSAGSSIVEADLAALSDTFTATIIPVWGNESSPVATMLGGFALTSTNLFVNNSYIAPSRIIKSNGGGTWSDVAMSLSSDPGNTLGIWGTGSLVLVGGQAGTTSNAIIRSTDAGSTWSTIANSFTNQVWWIHGTSTSNIWASAGFNDLLHSTDSGATWSQITTPGGFIEAVFSLSATDVWAVGDNSSFTGPKLYHYNGSTFTDKTSLLNNADVSNINSVWASSSSNIYIACSTSDYLTHFIYHSTDSGATFTLEYKSFEGSANSHYNIFGLSSSEIYVGFSSDHLLRSNGSGTWTREILELPYGSSAGFTFVGSILGTDTSHLWAAGAANGASFIVKKDKHLALRPDLTSITVTGATTLDGTMQYRAVGNYNDGRTVDITSDVTWSSTNAGTATISNIMSTIGKATRVSSGATHITATLGSISGFIAVNGSSGWSVFYDKANQPTSPATGYSTAPATGGNIAQYTGLAKVGSTIVASNGVQSWFSTAASGSGKYPFLTTTNNGSTFQVASWPLATDSNQALDGNSFYAPNIYATTDKFLVGCERNKTSNLATSTDGLTWSTSVQISPNNKAVAAFHSTSNSNIWAVSDTPTGSIYVWQSTDDGASWTAIGSPISSGGSTYFPSIFTISPTDVWVAGATNGSNANPCVYHYDGSTWTDCSAALRTAKGGNFNALIIGIYASSTNDVYFIDANFGHSQLYHTTNQGTSFTVIDVDASNSCIFNAISGTSSSNIYLAGYSGNIYHYNGSAWAKETLPSSPSYIATSDYLGLWIDGTTVYACGQNIIKK